MSYRDNTIMTIFTKVTEDGYVLASRTKKQAIKKIQEQKGCSVKEAAMIFESEWEETEVD